MSCGKSSFVVGALVLLASGAVGGNMSGTSSGFGSRGFSSSTNGSFRIPTGGSGVESRSGSAVGTPRDTQSGTGSIQGFGTTGGIGSTIGTPRDSEPGGGTTGGLSGINSE